MLDDSGVESLRLEFCGPLVVRAVLARPNITGGLDVVLAGHGLDQINVHDVNINVSIDAADFSATGILPDCNIRRAWLRGCLAVVGIVAGNPSRICGDVAEILTVIVLSGIHTAPIPRRFNQLCKCPHIGRRNAAKTRFFQVVINGE